MTDRADIVARITEIVLEKTNVTIGPAVVLKDTGFIDSLDLTEITMAVEDEYQIFPDLKPEDDWTIDKIADLVIAAKERA